MFKCVKPIIPRANNAVFRENHEHPEILEYIKSFRDPNRPPGEHGHIQLTLGDSGAPYWKECSNGNAELVAIHSGSITNIRGQYKSNDEYLASTGNTYQCINYATKMTKEIVQWIKDKDEEYFILDINL